MAVHYIYEDTTRINSGNFEETKDWNKFDENLSSFPFIISKNFSQHVIPFPNRLPQKFLESIHKKYGTHVQRLLCNF